MQFTFWLPFVMNLCKLYQIQVCSVLSMHNNGEQRARDGEKLYNLYRKIMTILLYVLAFQIIIHVKWIENVIQLLGFEHT